MPGLWEVYLTLPWHLMVTLCHRFVEGPIPIAVMLVVSLRRRGIVCVLRL